MKSMNKMAAGILLGMGLCAQPMLASAAPGLSVQSERAAHPRIVAAIREMNEALKELEAAPDDFGGNKAAAIADTHKGHSFFEKSVVFSLEDG
jgi:hypothetical protein